MAGISRLIVFGLAVWRACIMMTQEEGPFMIWSRWRDFMGAEVFGIPKTWENMDTAGKIAQCPYCLSVWVAGLLLVLRAISQRAYNFTALTLFGSAVTALIEDYHGSATDT